GRAAENHGGCHALLSVRGAASDRLCTPRLRGSIEQARRGGMGWCAHSRLVQEAARVKDSFFVPHNLDAPIVGAQTGPLAGLTAVVKDMYDIAGSRTGGGNPDLVAAQKPPPPHPTPLGKNLAPAPPRPRHTPCHH